MIRRRWLELMVVGAALASSGCLDFTGAACTTSATCPSNQLCISGRCTGSGGTGTGGAGTTGGGPGQGGGTAGQGGGTGGPGAECAPCGSSNDCQAGLECGRRACDGKRACFKQDGVCSTIGGAVCPEVLNFGDCQRDSQCQDFTRDGGSRCIFGKCLQQCANASECFIPQVGDVTSTANARCVTYLGDSRCYPSCTASGDPVCDPFNAFCARFSDNTYGFCDSAAGCNSCDDVSDCPDSTFSCGRRRCDGQRGCFPPDGGGCPRIDLDLCPSVNNFGVCSGPGQCGRLATCIAYGSSGLRCLQTCSSDSDCAQLVVAGEIYPSRCRPQAVGSTSYCVASCTSTATTCPLGTTCVTVPGDSRGFCQ